MGSVDFDVTAGSPRLVRITNVVQPNSFAFCGWFKILSYEDFGQLFSLSMSGDNKFAGLEYSTAVSGSLYINRDEPVHGYAESGAWSDGFADWFFYAYTSDGSNLLSYSQRQGGSWTNEGTLAIDFTSFTMDQMAIAVHPNFLASMNGRCLFSSIKIWNVNKTVAQLQAEALFKSVVNSTGLTFWNAFEDASTCQIDSSGTGGNFTKTGSPTNSSDDPGIPFGSYGILFPTRGRDYLARWSKRGRVIPRSRVTQERMLSSTLRAPLNIAPTRGLRTTVPGPEIALLSSRTPFTTRQVFTRFGGKTALLEGVTLDCDGNPEGGMTIRIFRDSDDVIIGTTTSDGVTGAWSFAAPPGSTYNYTAYKVGSPDIAGISKRGLVPA